MCSLQLADNHLDSVGAADVIASGDSAKQLLLLPYNAGRLSMTVHRMGDSLLVDNCDLLSARRLLGPGNAREMDLDIIVLLICSYAHFATAAGRKRPSAADHRTAQRWRVDGPRTAGTTNTARTC